MTSEQFASLAAEGFNRIPVLREVFADLDTPLSTYLKLADAPYSFLFESVQGGEKWGRYSIIGLPARTILRVRGHEVSIEEAGRITSIETVADPLGWVEAYQQQFRVPKVPELHMFSGGLVGYFGYDTIRYIETKLADTAPPERIGNPDIALMVTDELIVFDNLSGKLFLVVHADPSQPDAYRRAQRRIDDLVRRLRGLTPIYSHGTGGVTVTESDFISGFTQEGFENAVRRVKEYILDGDVMQVVLSQRLTVPFGASPLDLYRALRALNPSPYMFYMNLEDCALIGSSPEILTRLEDGVVTVRPIAGTRHRGDTEEEDLALEQELLADPKERAEHLMLIDLGRNDVGRVAQIGSVELTDRFIIERYSHVMHIVSNVDGLLKPGMSAVDVLRATFPAGTVSGAPKIRAMEIIDELEPVKREVYAGAVGYIGWNGNMDTAIAIRTAVIKDGELHVQAGAGIVADSDPRKEWEETMNKARALFKAVAMAEAGLE